VCLYDDIFKLFHACLVSVSSPKEEMQSVRLLTDLMGQRLHRIKEHELYAEFQAQMLQSAESVVARRKERVFEVLFDGAASLSQQLSNPLADRVAYEPCCSNKCSQAYVQSQLSHFRCPSTGKQSKCLSAIAVNTALCKEAPPSWKM
jgi:hypothetical protein